jgi:SAM-dependent methyltransferase
VNIRRPSVSKATVLAKYQETSLEAEEHRKLMSSKQTWENRFDEVADIIPWSQVRTWLDVGCGTAKLFETVISRGDAKDLHECVGIDAIANNIRTSQDKKWPARPSVRLLQWDIEDLDRLSDGPFDLVTMVGVVYQCGLPPAISVERCLGRLATGGLLLVTTENVRFKGFRADPHGCYPPRDEFEQMFSQAGRDPSSLIVQYTNPLWRQRATGIEDADSAEYKETFFLASY